MANLEAKIASIVDFMVHDKDETHKLSPCVLKQMLQELVVYVYNSDLQPLANIRSLIYDVLDPDLIVSPSDPRWLTAPDYVQWLCKQYDAGPYCSETIIELLWKERKLELLRGGLQPVYTKIRRYLL
jgi:hypothetical protein